MGRGAICFSMTVMMKPLAYLFMKISALILSLKISSELVILQLVGHFIAARSLPLLSENRVEDLLGH